VNDYGLELLSATEVDWPTLLPQVLQAGPDEQLLHEVLQSLNASELAQRRFREIARVSGLIFQGYPGEKRSNKQLQASSSLFWEVFRKYDPANRLLMQAEQELLAQELELGRLRASLARMGTQQLVLQTLARPTPFAFPLMVELFREKLSNESLADRITRMVALLEKAAGGAVAVGDVEQVKGTLAFGREGVSSGDGKGKRPSAPNANRRGRCPCCDHARELHADRQAIARGLCGRNRLAAARARLWWPACRVLFVADLHLGKAATYRALGQPVPAGTTRENLARLSALLLHYQPTQLVFLGDFLHAAQARTPSVLDGLAAWRENFPRWTACWCAATTTAAPATRRLAGHTCSRRAVCDRPVCRLPPSAAP
jgi:hypothetical protein